jgi:maleylacetoacetate isomerase
LAHPVPHPALLSDRIALLLKGIPYQYVPVNLVKREQTTPQYTKINPNKTVPALILDDGRILAQSISILEYLEDAFPDAVALLPEGAYERSVVRQIVAHIACDIQPLQNLRILNQIEADGGTEKKMAWGWSMINTGFVALEKILEKTAGKYCVGKECCNFIIMV